MHSSNDLVPDSCLLFCCVLLACWLMAAPVAAATQGDGEAENAATGSEPDASAKGRITRHFEIYNPHSKEQLQAVKDMGFTQVILDRPNLHAEASEVGLDVVLANWWTLETEPEEIEKRIEYAKQVDRRRLLAVSMMDEPERHAPATPFSYYQALYQDLRAHFDEELPGVKLEISHWGPLRSWTASHYKYFVPLYQATDRIRIMPYPDLYESPLSEVFYQMVRSRKLMKLANRDLPQVVILQTWVLPDDPKLPTIDELRVMAYEAILSGADTVSFFSYDPQVWSQTPDFTEGFAGLMKELTAFSRQHQNATVESRMSSSGVLTATITPPDADPLSVRVNTNRTAVDGLPALAVVIPSPVSTPQVQARSPCCCPTPKRRILRRRLHFRR
jgi:hypothetical protein